MEAIKSSSGDYYIKAGEIKHLSKEKALEIQDAIQPLLNMNAIIIVELDNLEELETDGYNVLFNIMRNADAAQSEVRFTNIPDEYRELFESLTLTSES